MLKNAHLMKRIASKIVAITSCSGYLRIASSETRCSQSSAISALIHLDRLSEGSAKESIFRERQLKMK